MTQEKALVIRTKGRSFVRVPYAYGEHSVLVNGAEWPTAKGDDSFLVVTGQVRSIERLYPPESVLAKYRLREDLRCSGKPEWLTPSEHERLKQADQVLYEGVREDRARPAVVVEFQCVDGDEPRALPKGITPIAPHHIDVYRWFWWTGPCRASSEFVLGQLKARLLQLNPQECDVTVYSNISYVRVAIASVTIGGVTYEPKTPLLHIDRDKGGIPSIDGEHLDDVLAKVDTWCDGRVAPILAVLSSQRDCPCCGRKLKTPTKPLARSGKRYPSHDIRD